MKLPSTALRYANWFARLRMLAFDPSDSSAPKWPNSGVPWPLDRRRLATVALALLIVLFYAIGYWHNPGRPDVSPDHPRSGWKDAWDQGNYYRSVAALENNDYSPIEHHYPIGYPLIGTLFSPVTPANPFLLPNLACYLAIGLALMTICQRFVSPEESFLVCFFGVVWPATVRSGLIEPWTNTPVSAAVMVLAALALTGRRDRFAGMLTGVCASVVFAVRPGDLLFSWPLLLALWLGSHARRDAWQRTAWFVIGALPLTIVSLYLSLAIHGNLVSQNYRRATTIIGFGFASLWVKLYTFLIDAYPLFGETRTLVTVYPVILLAFPGIVVFVRAFRWRALLVLATQIAAVLYFLSYNDFWINNAFRGGSIRYLLWLIPFCAFYAYLSLRLGWQRLGWKATGLMLVLTILAWILPQMSVRTVPYEFSPKPGADGLICVPSPNLACTLTVSLAKPAQFDVLKLRGVDWVKLMYTTAWIDGRPNRMFRECYFASGPDGTADLIFYSRQSGSNIRLTVPALYDQQQSFALSGFGLALRHSGLALRSPFRRFHPHPL